MKKSKTIYICQACGARYVQWQGQCSSCHQWQTIVKQVIDDAPIKTWADSDISSRTSKPIKIQQIATQNSPRINTGDKEFNRVLGGGIVLGSMVLIGGEPGIGKSTLLLQISLNLPQKVLYVSGEESAQQIKLRSNRIGKNENNCYVLAETKLEKIFNEIKQLLPELVVVDSIQTLTTQTVDSAASSVTQVRTCTAQLLEFAKSKNVPVILIGHITKEGHLAGPKVLEHMVDTVLLFEGDRNYSHRILRTQKNRFGPAFELGIYQMNHDGLAIVDNPSEILISQKDDQSSGYSIAVTVEGVRPLLIEVQALVSKAVYGTPQRSSTGFNGKRLNMLLAILEKRVGFSFGDKDVFVNITGGIKVEEPAIDLAVVMAVLSSYFDLSISQWVCFAAEIGLSGEIRAVPKIDARIKEAQKRGYKEFALSQYNKTSNHGNKVTLHLFDKIEKVIKHFFSP
ncbi:MAG: DNA repair protein RadA [Flavobacteriaceae bacterium]|nr:DNA repair protein RadA [Flavobacteriaceae bacterium]MCY4253843.1 DNA repair protein RadA [Flavobacteriaceae bacterium]